MPLTQPMRDTLAVIRTHAVTYTFRPLRRSVNRPLPVTSRDLLPVYSDGLRARTVEALIRRGLVGLYSRGTGGGIVKAFPTDTEEN